MKRLAFLLLMVLASCAHAGNGVSGITTQVSRSLTSVGIKAIVSGDDDANAELRLFQRWRGEGTGGQWDSGMVMVRRQGTNIHEGRILWMTPGRVAEWWVEAVDDGTPTRTAIDTVSCAQVRPTVATGPVYYVSKSGSDGAAGTLAAPFLTITKGLQALAASTDSGAYGGVIVAPGEYHERLDLTFGRDGKPRFVSGDRTNRDSTIICGAHIAGENGYRDATNAFSWTAIGYGTGAGAYPPTSGVYKARLDSATAGYGDSISSVIIGWGEYLHRKTSKYAVFQDSVGASSQGNLASGGETSGWYWAGDTLYVKRKGGASPSGSVFHFGYRNNLVAVGGRNWSVKNLTIRYGGGPFNDLSNGSEEDPGTDGNGIIAGRYGGNASGLVVDSCRIYGNVGIGTYAAYTSSTVRADSVTVANSIFDGLTIGTMSYAAAKGRTEEDANILKLTGSLSNAYYNTITETHNGIQTGPTSDAVGDSTWASGSEVYGNRITALSDDAIEVDTGIGINELVAMNTTDYTGSGISIAPVYEGPVFVFYNTFTRFNSAGLKIGNNSRAQVHLYQNTFHSDRVTSSNVSRAINGEDGGAVGKVVAYNNIFSARQAVTLLDASQDTCLFNYNVMDSTGTSNLITIDNSAVGFGAWRSTYGHEANGYCADPQLDANYRLKHASRLYPSSSAIGTGRRLPGVNYGLGGKRYAVSPNIGSKGCEGCYYDEQ